MGVHVIIDGYNLAHAAGLLSGGGDLEQAREDLCGLLASYKKVKAHKITIVFDAQHAPDHGFRRDQVKGVHVRYSPHGQLADSVIKNMARKEREKAVVVTSDSDVAGEVQACGAAAVSSQEFQARVMDALIDAAPGDGASKERRTDTRKKGPGRRPKKQRRRTARKAKKL